MSQKLVYYVAASVDGYITGPNEDLSWLDAFNGIECGHDEFMSTIGAIIMGRKTYELEVGFGVERKLPTFVLTRGSFNDSKVIFTSDIDEALDGARNATTKDIWLEGGSSVADAYFRKGLVDSIIVTYMPVVLGDGVPLFVKGFSCNLEVESVNSFEKGVIQVHYKVV